MSRYNEFKSKYNKIRNLSEIEESEPWLELIEEMLDIILQYELQLGKIKYKPD